MTEILTTVRLTRSEHAGAKELAAGRGQTIPNLMLDLLTEYAEGEMPKARPKAPAQDELTRTRVEVPSAIRRKVDRRAKAEGRSVSRVIADLVAKAGQA